MAWLWHSPKNNQMNFAKVMKLVNIVTSALAMFETSISKALKDGKIDDPEFAMLQTFHLEALNELINVDHKTETDMRAQLQKHTGRDQQAKEGHKEE